MNATAASGQATDQRCAKSPLASHQRGAGRGDAPRPAVFIIGEDVAEAGTPFKVLSGLVDEFGPQRVIDSPISEAGIAGIGVGAAMTGMRPVVDIMFGDFITLTMDQMVTRRPRSTTCRAAS